MILYPAIDLMGGRCVRLMQGRFEDATVYGADPAEALCEYAQSGARWAHIVDLDGARAGSPLQHELLNTLSKAATLKLQVAGGIRKKDDLRRLFDAGAARAVIGSLAVSDPDLVRTFFDEFGSERITLALDVRVKDGEPIVTTSGWQESSNRTLWEIAGLFPLARHMLIADVRRDGMLSGPNVKLISDAIQRLPEIQIQASGGVSSLDDLRSLERVEAAGAIVGKALWEKRIDLKEALRACA